MASLIIFCLFSSFRASAVAQVFNNVVVGAYLALDEESDALRTAARADAEAFHRYRRFPETTEGVQFRETCRTAPVNRFCPYLTEPESTAEPVAPRELRNLMFDVLVKLDDQPRRPTNCPNAILDLGRVLADPAAITLHSRALYWSWVCARVNGDARAAEKARDEAWTRFPLNHLTLSMMKDDPRLRLALSAPRPDWPIAARAKNDDGLNDLLRGIEALIAEGRFGAADLVLRRARKRFDTAHPHLRLYVGGLAARAGIGMPSVHPVWRTLVPLLQFDREYLRRPVLELLFPRPALIFNPIRTLSGPFELFDFVGLVHLESALNPLAASQSKAYGLTQLLLPTATDRWRELSGLSTVEVQREMLFEPTFSLRLGAFDLTKRVGTFKGDVRLALASYHAGESAIKKWLTEVPTFTDPEIRAQAIFLNREQPRRSSDYVMNVQSRSAWYRALYAKP